MELQRCSYKKSGEPDRVPRKRVLDVPLAPGFAEILEMLTAHVCMFPLSAGTTSAMLTADFLQVAMIERFEDLARMKAGEFLARVNRGERFKWERLGNGEIRLAPILAERFQ